MAMLKLVLEDAIMNIRPQFLKHVENDEKQAAIDIFDLMQEAIRLQSHLMVYYRLGRVPPEDLIASLNILRDKGIVNV